MLKDKEVLTSHVLCFLVDFSKMYFFWALLLWQKHPEKGLEWSFAQSYLDILYVSIICNFRSHEPFMFCISVKRITKTYLFPGTTRSFLKLGLQKGTIFCFLILMGKRTHNLQDFHLDLWGCSHEGVRFLVLSLKQTSWTWKGLLRRGIMLLNLVILMEKVQNCFYFLVL